MQTKGGSVRGERSVCMGERRCMLIKVNKAVRVRGVV